MLKPWLVLPAVFSSALLLSAQATQDAVATPPAPVAAAAAAANVPPATATASVSNPLKPTAAIMAKAKKTYGYDCAMCHGEKGDGKGDLVADMKLKLKDYTDPASLKDVPDGDIFTVIQKGKGQMTGEGDRAKPDDIWALVLYVRSLSQK